MSFRVEPEALRTYAGQLADARRAADTAKAYANKWGTFSDHGKGILGMVWPNHTNYLSQINTMLQHLADLTDASGTALKHEADHYEHTDLNAEGRIDATYPAVPRAPINRD